MWVWVIIESHFINSNADNHFYCQSQVNIDDLPVEKMVDTNHGGTVRKICKN